MSYTRDRDAHTRGVGAVAAADHMRVRATKRRLIARRLAARDRALAGLTYGPGGGLAGYGALEQLGAISVTGTSMQSIRQPIINGGGLPEGPQPPPQRQLINPTRIPSNVNLGPRLSPNPSSPTPPLRAGSVFKPGTTAVLPFPVVTSIGPLGPGGGTWQTSGSAGGVTTVDPNTGTITTSGGSTGTQSADGSGGGIVTGGSSGPSLTPPPDVPDAPDGSSSDITIAGVTVPKTALLVGAGIVGYLLWRKGR